MVSAVIRPLLGEYYTKTTSLSLVLANKDKGAAECGTYELGLLDPPHQTPTKATSGKSNVYVRRKLAICPRDLFKLTPETSGEVVNQGPWQKTVHKNLLSICVFLRRE